MITLYHGSYIAIASPLVGLGRKKVDFGQVFISLICMTKQKPGLKQ